MSAVHSVQYVTTQPAPMVTYATQPAYMTQPAQIATYASQPSAPVTTYMTQQPMQYVVEQPPTGAQYIMQDGQVYIVEDPAAQQVQYVTADGQLLAMGDEQQYALDGQQVQYVPGGDEVQYMQTEDGQLIPVQYDHNTQQYVYLQQPQPEVYNITPEQFARLAAGGALTDADLGAISGVAAAPAAVEQPAAALAAPAAEKRSTKKKLTSKKAMKGCC